MPTLKLPKLPERAPVKIAFAASPALTEALQLYATLYEESYGTAEPVTELIPAMLERFLHADAAFQQARRKRAAAKLARQPKQKEV